MEKIARTSPPLLKIFSAAFLISLIGSLPFGVLNTTASHIAMTDGLSAAAFFSIGAIAVEVAYALIAMLASARIQNNRRLLALFEIVSSCALVGAGIWYLVSHPASMDMMHTTMSPATSSLFILGMLLSALNFVALPFWLFWGTHLAQKNIFTNQALGELVAYSFGIAAGTFIGFLVFGIAHHFAAQDLPVSPQVIQIFIGSVLIATAFLQTRKTFFRNQQAESGAPTNS